MQSYIVNTDERDYILYPNGIEKNTLIFKKDKPLPVSPHTAADLISGYKRFKGVLLKDLGKYYPEGFTTAVIRDAGIGDLLLLEPLIRWMKKTRKTIEVATAFPEVYKYHPSVDKVFLQARKYDTSMFVKRPEVIERVPLEDFSERHPRQRRVNRTDIYFDYFQAIEEVGDKDKEPRLYFDYVPQMAKEKEYQYIGVSLDATQKERSFSWESLPKKKGIKYILISARPPLDLVKRPDIIDRRGHTTVEEMFSLVADLDGMIATDSGVMHVALTLHVPTYCVFSIVAPHLRIKYYTGAKDAVEVKPGEEIDFSPALDFIKTNRTFKLRGYHGKKNKYKSA